MIVAWPCTLDEAELSRFLPPFGAHVDNKSRPGCPVEGVVVALEVRRSDQLRAWVIWRDEWTHTQTPDRFLPGKATPIRAQFLTITLEQGSGGSGPG